MMSDKALVKQLQKEVARLESELKTPGSICEHGPLLRKKDTQIEKVGSFIYKLHTSSFLQFTEYFEFSILFSLTFNKPQK